MLPAYVLGKLGGPSQRRLPASMVSEVLKGVRLNNRVDACFLMWPKDGYLTFSILIESIQNQI